MTKLLSGVPLTWVISSVCPVQVNNNCPSEFQIFTLLSLPPVIILVPSNEKATEVTQLECAFTSFSKVQFCKS